MMGISKLSHVKNSQAPAGYKRNPEINGFCLNVKI
jgi:hypothetical protein